MYNRRQTTNIRSKYDAQWSAEEQCLLYRGLVKIYNREKTKNLNQANALRRSQASQIRELRKDVQYFTSYIGSELYGNRHRVRNTVTHPELRFMSGKLTPNGLAEYLDRYTCRIRRMYDCLKYRKNERMELYKRLKMERAERHDLIEQESERTKLRRVGRVITNKIQTFVVRQNVACHINILYQKMVDILKKDKQYFSAIVHMLEKDSEEQCKCILRTTELGQFAQEEHLNIVMLYAHLDKAVKSNMKEREKQVKHMKKATEALKYDCTHLAQATSYAPIYKTFQDSFKFSLRSLDASDEADCPPAFNQLCADIEGAMDATQVHTYTHIFPQMVRQVQHEELLYLQMKKLTELRKRALHMKHQGELVLKTLEHEVNESDRSFGKKKQQLEELLADEKYRLEGELEAIEEDGEMMMMIKSQLHNLFETLSRYKEESPELARRSSDPSDIDVLRMTAQEVEKTFPAIVTRDPGVLLETVCEQLRKLNKRAGGAALEGFTLLEARADRQTESLRIRAEQEPVRESEETHAMEEEVDIEDANILSRGDVKVLSLQTVEKGERLAALAKQGGRPKRHVMATS